jgi:hypothetical protein
MSSPQENIRRQRQRRLTQRKQRARPKAHYLNSARHWCRRHSELEEPWKPI